MPKKLAYSAWCRMELERVPEENRQDARPSYFSDSGKITKYDEYRTYCRTNRLDYDGPPEGYWESKEKPWHKPTGYLLGLASILAYFALLVIGGSTTKGR